MTDRGNGMQVEAYTAVGVVTGGVAPAGGLHGGLESEGALVFDTGAFYPLDGGAPRRLDARPVAADDILALGLSEDPETPVFAVWHPITLEAGPYRLTGELPTQPGFDPGRALTRPGGSFLLLRAVRLELLGGPAAWAHERPWALVNRYTIDRVAADLVLGFFFPGARLETPEGRPA